MRGLVSVTLSSRLVRAVRQLDAERLGDGTWRVWGGTAPHIVDAETGSCDCADHRYRGGVCAHIVRVRLAIGDAATIAALREFLPAPAPARARRPRNAPTRTLGREWAP